LITTRQTLLAWTLLRKLVRCWTLSGDHAIDYSQSNRHICSLALWHYIAQSCSVLSVRPDAFKLVQIFHTFSCFVQGWDPDDKGRPIFMLSSISPHTKHLRQDSRCSFTVLAPAFRVRAHHLVHHLISLLTLDCNYNMLWVL